MSSNNLYAYRKNKLIAVFTKVNEGVVLEYAPSVVEPISLSLPIGVDNGKAKPRYWLENLLPTKAAVLNELVKYHGIPRDRFELLKKIGRDVAGEIVLVPEGYTPSGESIVEVGNEEIATTIQKIKSGFGSVLPPFGERMSLAGAQEKFSLSRISGKWFTSTLNTPSTHIFKPGPKELSGIENAEAATLNLANLCGVSAATSTVMQFNGATTYVTERFDRYVEGIETRRRSMEDINQALGKRPGEKYNTSFKNIMNELRGLGVPEPVLIEWNRQLIFNVHVGNYDAHSKNYSLMRVGGFLRMSPLYDSIPLIAYHPRISKDGLAMPINGKRFSPEISRYDWESHALSCGFDTFKFDKMVLEIVQGIQTNYDNVFGGLRVADLFRESVFSASRSIR